MKIHYETEGHEGNIKFTDEQERQFLACCQLMLAEPGDVIQNLIKGYIVEAMNVVEELIAPTIKH